MAYLRTKLIPRIVDGQRMECGPYFYLVDKSGPKVRQKYLGADKAAAEAWLREFQAGASWDVIGPTKSAGSIPIMPSNAPIIPDVPYVSPTVIDPEMVGTTYKASHGVVAQYDQTYMGVDIYCEPGCKPGDIAKVKEMLAYSTAGQRIGISSIILLHTLNRYKINGQMVTEAGGYKPLNSSLEMYAISDYGHMSKDGVFIHELNHDTYKRLQGSAVLDSVTKSHAKSDRVMTEHLQRVEREHAECAALDESWEAACAAEGPVSAYAGEVRYLGEHGIEAEGRNIGHDWHNENFAESSRMFLRDDIEAPAKYPRTYAAWKAIRDWDEREVARTRRQRVDDWNVWAESTGMLRRDD